MKKTNQMKRATAQGRSEYLEVRVAISSCNGEKIVKEVDTMLREQGIKADYKQMGVSHFLVIGDCQLKVFIPRYGYGWVYLTINKSNMETKKFLEDSLAIVKKYYVEHTDSGLYYSYQKEIHLNVVSGLVNARRNINAKHLYEIEHNFYAIQMNEHYDINPAIKDDGSDTYFEKLTISVDVQKGTLTFLPNLVAKLFAEKDVIRNSIKIEA